MMNCRWTVSGLLVVSVLVVSVFLAADGHPESVRASVSKPRITAQPVEASMHEFMEYVFEPPYKRLRTAMASPPDNAGWKAIKSDALILAEAGNLLLLRHPEKDEASWREHSSAVRELGKTFYLAARKKDYVVAKTSYAVMLGKCNSCHDRFADGEHQLKP
jgi:hypothetical protein